MGSPLADRIRPETLEDVVGQRHLVGKDKVLYKLITSKNIPNMIFYGPSGTGKTTIANIAAKMSGKKLYKLNATNASVSDIKAITADLGTLEGANGVLLYLDEIQNFNKKQQQSLLEFIENGSITLIASTTENPYFYIYNAILSRATVFEFLPVEMTDIIAAVRRGVSILEDELAVRIETDEAALEFISQTASGDVRKALNTLELCVMAATIGKDKTIAITTEFVEQCTNKKAFRHDKDGDSHYDVISAFQKSLRGSDPDAAVHYLARLLSGGDMLIACRRLMVTAAEDIGLAYPQAVAIVKACVDSALQLGLPEARIPLAQAVVTMATAPKSNSSYMAINQAMADVRAGKVGDFPRCLQNVHYDSAEVEQKGQHYLYPHDYPNLWVAQQYLPDDLVGTQYYRYGDNKTEQAARAYWEARKKEK